MNQGHHESAIEDATRMTRPIALVTGASAGMGREFATQLAKRGYDLVLVARDEERLEGLANELKSFGASSEVLAADLTVDADVSRIVERIDRLPIDVLVNNAGFGTLRSYARESREQQDAMIRVHVLAANRLAHAAIQGMVPRRTGAIINVSSIASWMTSPGNVNYSATKAWQRSFIESLALELRGKGVYVQALCPGFTHTEFHARGGMDMGHTRPSWWMTAERVVAASLAALDRRRPSVVVPGAGYKVVVLALRFMPQWCWRLVINALRGRRRSGEASP
jgi:short-subunit dehydrogenase